MILEDEILGRAQENHSLGITADGGPDAVGFEQAEREPAAGQTMSHGEPERTGADDHNIEDFASLDGIVYVTHTGLKLLGHTVPQLRRSSPSTT